MSGEIIIKPVTKPVIINPNIQTTIYKPSTGLPGPPGPGVPIGGDTGDVLTKSSSTDYDTEWSTIEQISQDVFAEERYTHIQPVSASTWTVTHGLNRYPIVSVTDSSGSTVYGDVVHLSANQTQLIFEVPFSGTAEFI